MAIVGREIGGAGGERLAVLRHLDPEAAAGAAATRRGRRRTPPRCAAPRAIGTGKSPGRSPEHPLQARPARRSSRRSPRAGPGARRRRGPRCGRRDRARGGRPAPDHLHLRHRLRHREKLRPAARRTSGDPGVPGFSTHISAPARMACRLSSTPRSRSARRDHQDRRRGLHHDLLGGLEPIEDRHDDVHGDQIGPELARELHRAGAVLGLSTTCDLGVAAQDLDQQLAVGAASPPRPVRESSARLADELPDRVQQPLLIETRLAEVGVGARPRARGPGPPALSRAVTRTNGSSLEVGRRPDRLAEAKPSMRGMSTSATTRSHGLLLQSRQAVGAIHRGRDLVARGFEDALLQRPSGDRVLHHEHPKPGPSDLRLERARATHRRSPSPRRWPPIDRRPASSTSATWPSPGSPRR